MAIFDNVASEIVIRLVYDGPPEAGKTTSLRALASSLAQQAVTPEEDASGRTLWFDWMEYVGGRFEGSQIRCQIVSVPGQTELSHRRRLLLADADAVVFVADSTPERWERSRQALSELHTILEEQRRPVGVVLQANKRDVAGAIERGVLQQTLGQARTSTAIVESVASDGSGIREAFVYAVRLALDRVRELLTSEQLPRGRAALASPEQLLAQMRDEEANTVPPAPSQVESAPDSLAAALFREVLRLESETPTPLNPATLENAPLPPDSTVPSGAIWPPVEGRALLHEMRDGELVVRALEDGGWCVEGRSEFRIVSGRDDAFESLDSGRAALVQWARMHASVVSLISMPRCIVLAATGDGRWRLWQIIKEEKSLRDLLRSAVEVPGADAALHRVCRSGFLLADLNERMSSAPVDLPCTLDTVGESEARATFVGLMPHWNHHRNSHSRTLVSTLLENELGPILEADLAARRSDLRSALGRMPRSFVERDAVVDTLAHLLGSNQSASMAL